MQLYYLSNRANLGFTNYPDNVFYGRRNGVLNELDGCIFPQEH